MSFEEEFRRVQAAGAEANAEQARKRKQQQAEAQRKRHADTSTTQQRTQTAAERSGDDAEDDTQIAEINATHALVLAGNKAAVMKFEDKTNFRLLQVGAFKQWFSNQLISVGKKFISLGEYWLSHPERRNIRASNLHRRDLPFAPVTTTSFRVLLSNPSKANARNFWRT
jgi:hypothetical protein